MKLREQSNAPAGYLRTTFLLTPFLLSTDELLYRGTAKFVLGLLLFVGLAILYDCSYSKSSYSICASVIFIDFVGRGRLGVVSPDIIILFCY